MTSAVSRLDWVNGETSIDLVSADGPAGDYTIELLADGFDPGSPEAVKEVTSGLFLDGDYVIATRDGNVVKAFNIRITAPDSRVFADAEAVLDLMRGRRGSEIRWVPWDGYGATSVRKIMVADWAQVGGDFADLMEIRRGQRIYRITLECLPHVYSLDEVTHTVGTGETMVDDASAMTNWTVVSGSASASAGAITTSGATTLDLTPTVEWDAYAVIQFAAAISSSNLDVSLGGVAIPDANRRDYPTSVATIVVPTGSARGTKAVLRLAMGLGPYTINQVTTRTWPDAPTVPLDVFDAAGSRRSPALVKIYRSAGALGDVFLYTAPDPNRALADGASFDVFGKVTVAEVTGHEGEGGFVKVAGTPKPFGVGITYEDLGQTEPQAVFLGRQLWPPDTTVSTTGNVNTVTVGATYAYPSDRDAKVSYLTGITKKCVWFVPRTPAYPSGGVFVGDQEDGSDAAPYTLQEGDLFDPPAVFPDRSGIYAAASNGGVATITWTPAWAFNAGQ